MVADYCAGADCGLVSDLDLFSENRARADGYILADSAGWGNDGGGMDGASALRIAEKFGGSGEGEPGLRGDQKRFGCAGSDVCGREISDDDSGGGRGEGGSERLETVETVMEASPRRWQPSFSARSRRVWLMVVYCRFIERVRTMRVNLFCCEELEPRPRRHTGGEPCLVKGVFQESRNPDPRAVC
jgi:hypothetical protein